MPGHKPAPQSAAFEKAAAEVTKLKAPPSQDQQLQLYSLYKVGKDEQLFSEVKAPGMLDFKGNAKYKAWKTKVDAKLTPADAQKEYVALVEKLKQEKGF